MANLILLILILFAIVVVVRLAIVFDWFSKIAHWAEQNKFWADISKSIVFGLVGALVAATYFESLKNRIARKSEVDKAKISFRANAIKDFAEKSYKFTSIAVRHFEGERTEIRNVFDEYRNAQHTLELLLKNHQSCSSTSIMTLRMQRNDRNMINIINEWGNRLYCRNDSGYILHDTLGKRLVDTLKQSLFEDIRQSIKSTSDSIELNAIDNL